MTDEIQISEGQLKRLKNLKLYRDKTDEEIIEMLKNRQASVPKQSSSKERTYEDRFNEKLDNLTREFGVDMNNSNDPLMLENLVNQLLQAEDTNKDIRAVQSKENKTKDDILTLKALGDFQRDIQMTIADLQDKLGITRKVRKEKAVDDIPQFLDNLLDRAKRYWADKTHPVMCPKCDIELARYWLNFPELTTITYFTCECPHCGEKVEYNR
jgi:hypothetical protein